MGEAARGPLGDIREWGGVAWAKLGSCCWRQWPWCDLYNASRARRQSSPCHLPGERVEALYNGKWYGCTVVRMRATDADVAVDGGEWTVEVATEMRAATAAVPSQTQQLAEVSGLRWVGETPPAIAIAECEKAEGARAEGGERKRKREGCGL